MMTFSVGFPALTGLVPDRVEVIVEQHLTGAFVPHPSPPTYQNRLRVSTTIAVPARSAVTSSPVRMGPSPHSVRAMSATRVVGSVGNGIELSPRRVGIREIGALVCVGSSRVAGS